MTIKENKRKNANEFPVLVEFNSGEIYFTVRAATELRDKLDSVLHNLKQKGIE